MSGDQQALDVLEELDKVLQIDWNRKEQLLKAINKGLNKSGCNHKQKNKERSTSK